MNLGDDPIESAFWGDRIALAAYWGDDLVWRVAPPKFTVSGTSFSPQLELAAGSVGVTVQWIDETDTVVSTALVPTITWGSSGPHEVRLVCNNYARITTLNLGFHDQQDNGRISLPSSYNRATQPVTGIENLQVLVGLERFMAARTNGTSDDSSLYTGPVLAGFLNFSGMTHLEFIECFNANVQSITLQYCTALERICFEACNLTSIDLNPVLDNVQDFRAAKQQGGALAIVPWTKPAAQLWHCCIRGQVITGMPSASQLPAIEQLWAWNSGLSGTITVQSGVLFESLLLSGTPPGTQNTITGIDVSNTNWGAGATRLYAYNTSTLTTVNLAGAGPIDTVRLENCSISSINMTGTQPIESLLLYNNNLNQATVDTILGVVNGWGTSNGTLRMLGNAAPSQATGEPLVNALLARGWTVEHAPIINNTLIWSDDFNSTLGAGWQTTDTVSGATSGGDLVLTETSGNQGYRRFWNYTSVTIPANFAVEIDFTAPLTPASWWGILGRWNGTNGAKALLTTNATTLRIGEATTASNAATLTTMSGFPATWTNAGVHTLRAEFYGTTVTVLADGQAAYSATVSTNSALTGHAIGFLGEPQGRHWHAIRVYSI